MSKKNQIIFYFKSYISDKEVAMALRKIRSWSKVESVERVFDDIDVKDPKSKVKWWTNLYVVYAIKKSHTSYLVKKLNALDEIDEAYIPSVRSLK